jgi:hypothetical protein
MLWGVGWYMDINILGNTAASIFRVEEKEGSLFILPSKWKQHVLVRC